MVHSGQRNKHTPVGVAEVRYIAKTTLTHIKALEQNLTAAYMDLYGTNNVRGGIFFNYPGPLLRVGDKVIGGYMFTSYISAFMFMFADVYIILRHYFGWW